MNSKSNYLFNQPYLQFHEKYLHQNLSKLREQVSQAKCKYCN